jgi:hypothetical protein
LSRRVLAILVDGIRLHDLDKKIGKFIFILIRPFYFAIVLLPF